jgi:hypothetical protein
MNVLEYIADPMCQKKLEGSLTAEYRMLCSGTLFRDVVGDPFKSEVARILLDRPFVLFATSRPLEDYPQELMLELSVPSVEIHQPSKTGTFTYGFHPDKEVASDLAALLCLLCRRSITVCGKTRERPADYAHPLFGLLGYPMPLATTGRRVFWRPHPISVAYSLQGAAYRDYNPPAKAVDPHRLTMLLTGLPRTKYAESIVMSCRLYALALELIHDRSDLAYPLLISSVETIANAVLERFQPNDDAKVAHKKAVYDLAIDLQLSKESAKQLAMAACKGEYWATRKFKDFLLT